MGVYYFDTEYVNNNLYTNDIIELSLINSKSKNIFTSVIKLPYNLPHFNTKLTGITNNELNKRGVSFPEAFSSMLKFIDNEEETTDLSDVLWIAQDGFRTDYPMLISNAYKHDCAYMLRKLKDVKFADSMIAFKNLGYEKPGLPALAKKFNINTNGQRHRSYMDVKILMQLCEQHHKGITFPKKSFSAISIYVEEQMPMSVHDVIFTKDMIMLMNLNEEERTAEFVRFLMPRVEKKTALQIKFIKDICNYFLQL